MENGTEMGYKEVSECPVHDTPVRKVYGRVITFRGCKCALHVGSDNFTTYHTAYELAAGKKALDYQRGY